jgi:hypothetical protein
MGKPAYARTVILDYRECDKSDSWQLNTVLPGGDVFALFCITPAPGPLSTFVCLNDCMWRILSRTS